MNVDTNQAQVILDAVLNDKNIGKAGYRNDLMVDACIAGVCLGMDQEILEQMVTDAIDIRMAAEVPAVDPLSVPISVRMTLEHIDRIWPYAKRWFRNGETAEKLLGSYSNNGDN